MQQLIKIIEDSSLYLLFKIATGMRRDFFEIYK